jgi:hypothetical protein
MPANHAAPVHVTVHWRSRLAAAELLFDLDATAGNNECTTNLAPLRMLPRSVRGADTRNTGGNDVAVALGLCILTLPTVTTQPGVFGDARNAQRFDYNDTRHIDFADVNGTACPTRCCRCRRRTIMMARRIWR